MIMRHMAQPVLALAILALPAAAAAQGAPTKPDAPAASGGMVVMPPKSGDGDALKAPPKTGDEDIAASPKPREKVRPKKARGKLKRCS